MLSPTQVSTQATIRSCDSKQCKLGRDPLAGFIALLHPVVLCRKQCPKPLVTYSLANLDNPKHSAALRLWITFVRSLPKCVPYYGGRILCSKRFTAQQHHQTEVRVLPPFLGWEGWLMFPSHKFDPSPSIANTGVVFVSAGRHMSSQCLLPRLSRACRELHHPKRGGTTRTRAGPNEMPSPKRRENSTKTKEDAHTTSHSACAPPVDDHSDSSCNMQTQLRKYGTAIDTLRSPTKRNVPHNHFQRKYHQALTTSTKRRETFSVRTSLLCQQLE